MFYWQNRLVADISLQKSTLIWDCTIITRLGLGITVLKDGPP